MQAALRELMAAVENCCEGKPLPLEEWFRCRHEGLVGAVARRFGVGADLATRAVAALVEAAWVATYRGQEIHAPVAWCRTVLRRMLSAELATLDHAPVPVDVLDELPSGDCVEDRVETLDELRWMLDRRHGAIEQLPPPYREILDLQIQHEWTRARIARYLLRWAGVSQEQARRLIRDSHGMLRETMAGADPRQRWPRRFSKRNRFLEPPPPRLTHHECVESGGEPAAVPPGTANSAGCDGPMTSAPPATANRAEQQVMRCQLPCVGAPQLG